MLKLENFKHLELKTPAKVNGGAHTTHNGKTNGDYEGDGWLYVYADETYYYQNSETSFGGEAGSYQP